MADSGIEIPFLNEDRDDDEAQVTLFDHPKGIHLWFENADGECSKVFTHKHFSVLVKKALELKGWVV